ncbi:hypothetical protein EPN83_00825 [Patescibacteria group bacterium]|nr:MAG: hypothetical protein EPN83_00825 [Patescibacteria group bacterium]
MIEQWLRESVEWRNWDLNVVTISFIATVFFTILSGWSLVKQKNTIQQMESGKAVSVPLFSYLCSLFFTFLYYGIVTNSIAPVINGLLGILYLQVLFGLWRHKGFSKNERRLVKILPLIPLGMIILPWKDTLMTAAFAGGLLAVAHQLYELWQARDPGAVDINYVSVFFVSTLFWTIYAYAAGNVPLQIINPPTLVVLTAIILLWFRYRRLRPTPQRAP